MIPRKLPWFALWSLFLLRLLVISINLSYSFEWNTVDTSWQVLLAAIWISWINCWSVCVGLLIFNLQPLFNPCPPPSKCSQLSLFFRFYFGRCSSERDKMVPVPQSCGRSTCYSNKLHDLLSPFLDIIKISVSSLCFFTQLDSGIFRQQNYFLWRTV